MTSDMSQNTQSGAGVMKNHSSEYCFPRRLVLSQVPQVYSLTENFELVGFFS